MQDRNRAHLGLVGSPPFDDETGVPSVEPLPAWTMCQRDLDDLESSLRYLEQEDHDAWARVQLLLNDLRADTVRSD